MSKKKSTKNTQKQMEFAANYSSRAADGNLPFSCSSSKQPKSDENALDIIIEEVKVVGTGKKGTILFDEASLHILNGKKYGFVGANGMGKTTLLRLLVTKSLPIPPMIDMLMVEQEIEGTDVSAIDAVLATDKKRTRLLNKETELFKELEDKVDPAKITKISEDLQQVASDLEQHGAALAESKARKILSGLGFTTEMQERATKKFSGGWRMRVSLARALFIEPTLLLLDEPTNHLDLNAVLWLNAYLQEWKKTIIIVSHDQDFLNNVVTDIIHLDDRKLIYYKGNYENFKKGKEQLFRDKVKAWEKQQKNLKNLKKNGKNKKDAKAAAVKKTREKGARAAKKAEKLAGYCGGQSSADHDKAMQLLERPREYRVRIQFSDPSDIPSRIIEIIDVEFNYPESPSLLQNVNFSIYMGDRICIVGPNGVGKSTFLNLLMGSLIPIKGEIRRDNRLRVGYYNQHFDEILPMKKSPVQFLMDNFELDYQKSRNLLGRFGLGGHAHEIPLESCSGGQKARVVMASLVLQEPHILVLDEPTNHLDIETIDALALGLQNFKGAVILVSHDERLITEVDCGLWVCDNKTLTFYEDGFDCYRDQLLEELEAKAEERERMLEEKEEQRKQKREILIANLK